MTGPPTYPFLETRFLKVDLLKGVLKVGGKQSLLNSCIEINYDFKDPRRQGVFVKKKNTVVYSFCEIFVQIFLKPFFDLVMLWAKRSGQFRDSVVVQIFTLDVQYVELVNKNMCTPCVFFFYTFHLIGP